MSSACWNRMRNTSSPTAPANRPNRTFARRISFRARNIAHVVNPNTERESNPARDAGGWSGAGVGGKVVEPAGRPDGPVGLDHRRQFLRGGTVDDHAVGTQVHLPQDGRRAVVG